MRAILLFLEMGGVLMGGMKMLLLFAVLLAGLPGFCLAGGNKKQAVTLSFHIETEGADNPKMIFPHFVSGRERYFRRIPEVSSRDLLAFSPFPADDGASYGVVFQLKGPATRRYAAVTNMSTGRWLLAQSNGRVVDAVLIDKPVEDGMIVVWKGITLEEIAEFDKLMPRIGQAKKKGKS